MFTSNGSFAHMEMHWFIEDGNRQFYTFPFQSKVGSLQSVVLRMVSALDGLLRFESFPIFITGLLWEKNGKIMFVVET